MKKIFMQIQDTSAGGYYRAYLPAFHCHGELLKEGIELIPSDKLDTRDFYDVYVFHRDVTEKFFPQLEVFKSRGSKIVWEADDLLTHVAKDNPGWSRYQGENLARYLKCLELADYIIVSTEALKRELPEYRKKVMVGRNLIDPVQLRPVEKQSDVVTIVWAGSDTHMADLEKIVPAVCRVNEVFGEKVRWRFFRPVSTGLAVLR